MANLLIKDHDNKVFCKLLHLSRTMDDLITKNILAINATGRNLQINDIDFDYRGEELLNRGWSSDDGLYERLIIEYNSSQPKLLTRWVR